MFLPEPPLIVGIAGGSGSGKTTVANVVMERLGPSHIAYLPHDAYYRGTADMPPEQRDAVNFDHPDSLETSLLVEHIRDLKDGRPVDLPVYDFATHLRTRQTKRIEPNQVILVEGILIFCDPTLRDLFDLKIFVDTDPDIRFIRRLQRDTMERGRSAESVIRQYLDTVRPMHLKFVEPCKQYADLIVPDGGLNVAVMDIVIARIQTLLLRSLSLKPA